MTWRTTIENELQMVQEKLYLLNFFIYVKDEKKKSPLPHHKNRTWQNWKIVKSVFHFFYNSLGQTQVFQKELNF